MFWADFKPAADTLPFTSPACARFATQSTPRRIVTQLRRIIFISVSPHFQLTNAKMPRPSSSVQAHRHAVIHVTARCDLKKGSEPNIGEFAGNGQASRLNHKRLDRPDWQAGVEVLLVSDNRYYVKYANDVLAGLQSCAASKVFRSSLNLSSSSRLSGVASTTSCLF